MSAALLLLIKVAVPPVLVALMSLAARRWGPTVGGLIMGLPWMTGPVLYFLGTEKGPAFLVVAAHGAELAVVGISAFILAFGYASRVMAWPGALGAAIAGYLAAAVLTQSIATTLPVATAGAAIVLLGTYLLLPLPGSGSPPGQLPAWDIPARMAATLVLVSIIVASVDLLGPQRSGILASYPVILSVIGVFTLRLWGRDALLRVLRGVSLSLLAFVGFFAVVGFGTPRLGATAAYAAATLTALTISGGLIAGARRLGRAAA